MSKFSSIHTIYEFISNESGDTHGVYNVEFMGSQKIFIRNGDSVGAVSHYFGKSASQCVDEIRSDVKNEFFEELAKKVRISE